MLFYLKKILKIFFFVLFCFFFFDFWVDFNGDAILITILVFPFPVCVCIYVYSPVQRHVGFDAVSTRGSLARDEAAARSDADARFSQAMIDLATVVKLDSRILLKIVIAAPGDTALLEPAQLHVTKNAAKLVRLLLDKLDAEQSSERRVTLLNELFVDDCRLLKTRVVQVVRATVAASGDRQYVEVLRQSHAKLGELVDTIVSNVATYRQQLRRRSENVKAYAQRWRLFVCV